MSAFLTYIGIAWGTAGLVNLAYFASLTQIEPLTLAFALVAPATGAAILSLGVWLKRIGVTYADLRGIQEGLIAVGGGLICLGVLLVAGAVATLAMSWTQAKQGNYAVMDGIVLFVYPVIGTAAALPGILCFWFVGLHVARRKRQPR